MTPHSGVADALILFAHGSRDPMWKLPIEAVAQQIRLSQPGVLVCCAYLELCEPDLPQAVWQLLQELDRRVVPPHCSSSALPRTIRIVPMFLGMGKHAREDWPELLKALRAQHPMHVFEGAPAVGEDPRVTQLLARVALGP